MLAAWAINDGVECFIGPHGLWLLMDDLLRVAKWRARPQLRGETKRDEMEGKDRSYRTRCQWWK